MRTSRLLLVLCLVAVSCESRSDVPLQRTQFFLDAGADAPPNTPPLALDDVFETDEDTAAVFTVLANDVDADGDDLTVFVAATAREGILVPVGDGTFSYTPRENFAGSDSFTYGVLDGNGGSGEATAVITVRPINDPPQLVNPTPPSGALLDVAVGDEVEFAIIGTDIDGDALVSGFDTLESSTTPTLESNTFRWVPQAMDAGSYTVRIFVSDGVAEDSRQLTLSVNQAPDAPCGQFVCTGDSVCVGETCFPPCATSEDCEGADRCFAGRCASDACSGVRCEGAQQCFAGGCFRPCSFDGECRPGERCFEDRCAEASCFDVVCESGSSCHGGSCRLGCAVDGDCLEGSCFDSGCALEACDGVVCPAGQLCDDGSCIAEPDAPNEDPRFEPDGCGCAQGGGLPGSVLLLFVSFALLRRRRTYFT